MESFDGDYDHYSIVAFGNARITLCPKMTICSEILEGHGPLGVPGYAYGFHVHDFNKWVFVEHNDFVRYILVIVIFYCAKGKHKCISYAWLDIFGRESLG